MMLSSMMRTGIKVASAAGMAALGYYAVPGVKRERMLQAVIGAMGGYVASTYALNMVPAAPAMETPAVQP